MPAPDCLSKLSRLLVRAVILLTCCAFGPPVLTDGGYPPLRLGPDEITGLMRLAQQPAVSAPSAIMVDLDARQTLYARQPDASRPPASTIKVMTALIALQQANIKDTVVVSANAATTGGSRMGLSTGEVVTVLDLLYGLLLPSGNDAAVALAEHVAGDEASFVAIMNQAAQGLGLTGTRFANPHGLDDDGQFASAADLLAVTRAALDYPVFELIIATPSATVAGRRLANTNLLLGSYPGADGIKTGTTDAAGECLIASVNRGGHRLVLVVLGSGDRYADARALFDYASAGWRWGDTTLPNDALAWELGSPPRFYRLRSTESFDIFLPTWQWNLLRPVRRIEANMPLTGTLPVGSLDWMLAADVVATVPLAAMQGP